VGNTGEERSFPPGELTRSCPCRVRRALSVEGLYCKRPFQCLASSEILTPQILNARRVHVYPPPLVRGEDTDTLARGREGGGSIVRKTPETALYSIYVSTFWLFPFHDDYLQEQKPNSQTYNFVEISRHNLESSQT
jgi:hypothetical protein